MGLLSFINKGTGINTLSSNSISRSKKPLRLKLTRRIYRIEANMKNWKTAVQGAEDTYRPIRYYLYMLYRTVLEDENLLSQIRTAKFNVQMAPFTILHDGQEVDAAKAIFQQPWFFEFLEHAVDTEMWGHSLIEFHDKNEDEFFQKIDVVPREHVRPELMYRDFILDPLASSGIPFDKGALSKYSIEIGKPDDLGLLKPISKLVIRKDYNIVDWGRRNERFGMPMIVAQTASRDEKELAEKEEMLENFGSNMWALFDDLDKFQLVEAASNSSGGHKSYLAFAEYIDKGIAKLVNGQTGTMEEKAHVGSAEVHERILNTYTLARMKRIQNEINFTLIPFLVGHSYPLSNCEFWFNDLMEKENEEGQKPTDPVDAPDTDNAGKKKALIQN